MQSLYTRSPKTEKVPYVGKRIVFGGNVGSRSLVVPRSVIEEGISSG
jgi:hypothetical protein